MGPTDRPAQDFPAAFATMVQSSPFCSALSMATWQMAPTAVTATLERAKPKERPGRQVARLVGARLTTAAAVWQRRIARSTLIRLSRAKAATVALAAPADSGAS